MANVIDSKKQMDKNNTMNVNDYKLITNFNTPKYLNTLHFANQTETIWAIISCITKTISILYVYLCFKNLE